MRRNSRSSGGSAIGVSVSATVSRGALGARIQRIRDFAVAHELAATGRVEEARALLAKYDTGAVVIEIVPGERGGGEVK